MDKEKLMQVIKQLVDDDAFTMEELERILAVCREAIDRKITDLAEQYLIESIEGNSDEKQ